MICGKARARKYICAICFVGAEQFCGKTLSRPDFSIAEMRVYIFGWELGFVLLEWKGNWNICGDEGWFLCVFFIINKYYDDEEVSLI